jgi:hypothetical protein
MPEGSCPCETLWIQDPTALLGTNLLVSDICESNNLNAFTRAFLLTVGLAALVTPLTGIGGAGILLVILIMLYSRWLFGKVIPGQRTLEVAPKREGFEGSSIRPGAVEPDAFPRVMTSPGATIVTRPTARNPFMNVLLDEIKYNPTRPPAENVSDPNAITTLSDFFRVQWNSDPTDVFGRSQSQRQFYTTPSTSIPNDQASYQNWLYLIPGKTCKEGGRDACVPGTNGAVVPWLSQPN